MTSLHIVYRRCLMPKTQAKEPRSVDDRHNALFIYYESRAKVHMKRLKNKNTSYELTTHTSNQ